MSTTTTAALLHQPEAIYAARLLHGALSAALATLEPIHGLSTAQKIVGEILSADAPPVSSKPARVIADLRRQPIYTFFEDDSTLDYLPVWQRELLRYERDSR